MNKKVIAISSVAALLLGSSAVFAHSQTQVVMPSAQVWVSVSSLVAIRKRTPIRAVKARKVKSRSQKRKLSQHQSPSQSLLSQSFQ